MSFPASLTTRIFQGGFVTYPDGKPAKGTVRIVLTKPMLGPSDDLIVAPFDETIPFDENGAFSVNLPSTNDPQWTPSSYKITVSITTNRIGGRPLINLGNMPAPAIMRAILHVPYDQTGPIDATDVFQTTPPEQGETYIILASKGAPGGVASLGSDGKVPTNQLPTGLGGEISWSDVTDKPASFPPAPHAHSTADVIGLAGALDSKASASDLTTGLAGKADTSHTHAFSAITGKPTTYPHDPITFTEITGKPSVYPAAAPAWIDVTGKPATFAPSAHAHLTSDITGLDTALGGKASTSHTHAFSEITGKPTTYPHDTITWTEISGKPSTFPADNDFDSLDVAGNVNVGDTVVFAPGAGEVRMYKTNPGQLAIIGALDLAGDISLGGRSYMYAGEFHGNLSATPASPTSGVLTYAQGGKLYALRPTGDPIEIDKEVPNIIVLGPSDTVPGGTPTGTIVLRTA